MTPKLFCRFCNIYNLNIHTCITFTLTLFLIAVSATGTTAQNAYEEGKKYFELRAAGADSFRAEPDNINKAIDYFRSAVDKGIHTEMSAAYLLRSYYFKGMFTGRSEEEKKELYEKGRTLGEEMMKEFPDSVPIKFWYAANMGRWAKVYGFVKAATSGVAQKLREVSKEIIRLDPKYQGGGGYRILAQVHFHSPSIPLLMGWPSDKKAMELVKKALEIMPDHPTNRLLYAELLLEFDRNQVAKKEFEQLIRMKPRPDHLVEDRYVFNRARELLESNF